MRRNFVVSTLFVLFIMAGAALAAPVPVDFSVMGINVADITVQNNPADLTLNGVTFRYDNQGGITDPVGNPVVDAGGNLIDYFGNPITAQIDSSGVWGSTYGALIFNFSGPVTGLNFDFSLLGAPSSFADPLFVLLYNAGSDVADIPVPATFVPYDPAVDPTQGDAVGNFAYNGVEFDQAVMYFSLDAPYFTVANLSYEPVPEPATLLILILGGIALFGRRKSRRNFQ